MERAERGQTSGMTEQIALLGRVKVPVAVSSRGSQSPPARRWCASKSWTASRLLRIDRSGPGTFPLSRAIGHCKLSPLRRLCSRAVYSPASPSLSTVFMPYAVRSISAFSRIAVRGARASTGLAPAAPAAGQRAQLEPACRLFALSALSRSSYRRVSNRRASFLAAVLLLLSVTYF